jgi:lysophospholipase L1-like esterase
MGFRSLGAVAQRGGTTGTSRLLTLASRVVPGIGRVHAQKEPFAAAWSAANAAALQTDGPLWVALGDSMTQGIGAKAPTGGWVGQLERQLADAGRPMRVVNLSATGARVRDVLDDQLPQLAQLGAAPALVTLLIGANDMLFRSRRVAAVRSFRLVLERLPAGVSVVATLPRGNPEALAINASVESAAAAGRLRIADMRGGTFASIRGTLAEDYFHPNEVGYARIAAAFAKALDLG